MVKEVYGDEKANQIMDRLVEAVFNKEPDMSKVMERVGIEFGIKLATGNLDFDKMVEDSVIVRNDRDELLICMPFVNINEVYKQYS